MTKRNYTYLLIFSFAFSLVSCEKKQIEKTAEELKGKFRITEFNYWLKFYNATLKSNDSIRVQNVFDLKNDIHTLEFFRPIKHGGVLS